MFFRKLFAGFFVIIFGIVFLPVSLVFGLYNTFSDEEFYESEVIDLSYEFLVEELPEGMDLSEFPTVEVEDVRKIFKKIFTKEDFSKVVKDVVDQYKNLEVDEEGIVEVKISLEWFTSKSDLIAEEIGGFLYDNLEVCSEDRDISEGELKCVPEGVSRMSFIATVTDIFNEKVMMEVPEETVFDFEMSRDFEGNVSEFVKTALNIFFLVSGIVLVFLLLLIGLIIYRPPVRVLKWIGKTLFLASLFVFVVVIGFRYIPDAVISVKEMEMYLRIYSFILNEIMWSIFIFVIPIMVIGLTFWIIFGVYDMKIDKKKQK